MVIGEITTALFSVVLALLPAGVFSQICHRLNPLLFQKCISLGYNDTAHFPNNFTLHENTIAYHLERDTRQFKQCSKQLDIIMCAIFVPKCVEDLYSPVLPCRRICEEFVRDCEPKVDYEKIEWIKGLCRLLPSVPSTQNDRNVNSHDCLEPANYKPRDNSTTPLIQNCIKLQMSSCSHLGYTHTTQSSGMQLILNNVLKEKLDNFGNHSMCSPTIKKIFCAEFAPPCFPEDKEDIVLRTVCKSDCENVQNECPELFSEHFGKYSFCEQMATEKSDLEGFCKLTKWPTAVRWPARPNDSTLSSTPVTSLRSPVPTPSSSTPSLGSLGSHVPSPVPLHTKVSTPVVVIVVSAVVIVMSIIGIVLVLVLRQRRRCTQGWTVRGYRHQLNEWETTVALKP